MANYEIDTTTDAGEIIVWVPTAHADSFRQFLVREIGQTFDYDREVFSGKPAGPNVPEGEDYQYATGTFTFPKPDDPVEHPAFEARIRELVQRFGPPVNP